MRRWLYIGAGGFLGAIFRYAVKNLELFSSGGTFKFNILFINITGCFIIAFFLRLAIDIWDLDADLRLGVSTGFIGAFTTFSTFCKEYTGLLSNGDVFLSSVYLFLSVTVGIFAVYLGDSLAKKVMFIKET